MIRSITFRTLHKKNDTRYHDSYITYEKRYPASRFVHYIRKIIPGISIHMSQTKFDIGFSELQFSDTTSHEKWYQQENFCVHGNSLLSFVLNVCLPIDWFCWGLSARQPLWVIFCRLPEKGRKKIEEIVEEMKERDREERDERKETKETKTLPSTLTCYKDSKPCPTVSQY